MFSKFSVLSKLYKFSSFENNGLYRILKCELSTVKLSPKGFIKNHKNLGFNPKGTSKIFTNFNVTRNMSFKNTDGTDKNSEISDKAKKLLEKRKKKFFRRRVNAQKLKSLEKKCTRYTMKGDPNFKTESPITKNIQRTDLKHKKANESSNMQLREPVSKQSILESQLPPKRVHVEFMESQNLKDFNLNKGPSQPIHRNTAKQALIDIQIKPLSSVTHQTISKTKAPLNVKNSLLSVETKDLVNNSNKDYLKDAAQKLKSLIEMSPQITTHKLKKIKSKSHNRKVKNISNRNQIPEEADQMNRGKAAKTAMEIKSNIQNKKKLSVQKNKNAPEKVERILKNYDLYGNSDNNFMDKSFSNNNTKNNAFSKSSENIRILYQAHPRRKTKIKIPKEDKSKNSSEIKPLQQQKQINTEKALITTDDQLSNGSFTHKGILFPTKPGEFLNLKIKPKNLSIETIKPFFTKSKGVLFPAKICKPPKDSTIQKTNKSLPNIEKPISKLKEPSKDSTIQKTNKPLPNIEIPISKIKEPSKASAIQKTNKPLPNIEIPISKLKEYNQLPINLTGTTKGPLNPTDKITDMIAKNSRNGTKDATNYPNKEAVHKKEPSVLFNEKAKNPPIKSRRSRFWRAVSLTILPLILGITVYAISNIGAVEMFKQMRYARSSEDPLSFKLFPTFQKNNANSKHTDSKETVSVDATEEHNLNNNESKSGNTVGKDTILDEA